MRFSEKYSIKDLEQLSGIKAHTLRIWEKRFELLKPKRTTTNIRYYSNDDLRRILNISLLNKNGIKISEISKMSDAEISEKVSVVNLIKTGNDDLIENLILGMIDMDEVHFDKIFSTCILKMGFEEAILNVIFPFLRKIGTMWLSGGINPAQEHFMSNIIRQKLIVATDGLRVVEDKNASVALLFLPENELHELSLLFYNYVLKARKIKTIYLGQSVPLDSLSRIINITKPDLLITVVSIKISNSKLDAFFKSLSTLTGEKKTFISGKAALEYKKGLSKNLKFFKDSRDLTDLIQL